MMKQPLVMVNVPQGKGQDVAGLIFDQLEMGGRSPAVIEQAKLDARLGFMEGAWSALMDGKAAGISTAVRLRSLPDNYTKAGVWLTYLYRKSVDGKE